jgi:hypothetical protein
MVIWDCAAFETLGESSECSRPGDIGGEVAAYLSALDSKTAQVRLVAAMQLHALVRNCSLDGGPRAARELAALTPWVIDRLEAERDDRVRDALARAVSHIEVPLTGDLCRVMAWLRRHHRSEPATELFRQVLRRDEVRDAVPVVDFAFEVLMSNRQSEIAMDAAMVVSSAAEAKHPGVCDRVIEVVRARVHGWAPVAEALWKAEGCARDAVVPALLAELAELRPTRPSNLLWLRDFPSWPGVTPQQRRDVCAAAAVLVNVARDESVKQNADAILSECDTDAPR